MARRHARQRFSTAMPASDTNSTTANALANRKYMAFRLSAVVRVVRHGNVAGVAGKGQLQAGFQLIRVGQLVPIHLENLQGPRSAAEMGRGDGRERVFLPRAVH